MLILSKAARGYSHNAIYSPIIKNLDEEKKFTVNIPISFSMPWVAIFPLTDVEDLSHGHRSHITFKLLCTW